MPNEMLSVGSLTAAPGEKRYGVNELSVGGRPYSLPMWLVNGSTEGPTLVVTGGVHAAEYASIAAALDLGRKTDPAKLRGRAIVVPVMNMPAFSARSIYVFPPDGKNLNRVFPGDPKGTASQQLAAWVFDNVITQGDYYVDLHGGDLVEALVPFTIFFRAGDARVDDVSLEMAKVFGIRYLVSSETPGSTFSAASRKGIPSILAESGGQGIWTPEDVGLLTDGLDRVMRYLKMIPGPAPEAMRSLFSKSSCGCEAITTGSGFPRWRSVRRFRRGKTWEPFKTWKDTFCRRRSVLATDACCSSSRRLR